MTFFPLSRGINFTNNKLFWIKKNKAQHFCKAFFLNCWYCNKAAKCDLRNKVTELNPSNWFLFFRLISTTFFFLFSYILAFSQDCQNTWIMRLLSKDRNAQKCNDTSVALPLHMRETWIRAFSYLYSQLCVIITFSWLAKWLSSSFLWETLGKCESWLKTAWTVIAHNNLKIILKGVSMDKNDTHHLNLPIFTDAVELDLLIG